MWVNAEAKGRDENNTAERWNRKRCRQASIDTSLTSSPQCCVTCLWPQLFLQGCGEELIENRKPLPSACEREFVICTSIRQEVCCTLQVTWMEWWYFAQFPALQIQMKDVSTGYKFPTLHKHRKFVRCPPTLASCLCDPIGLILTPQLHLCSQGWNRLNHFPGQ